MRIFLLLILTAVTLFAQAPQDQPITITSVVPAGESAVTIRWAGGIPPYKLQATYDSAGRGWRDMSYHLYTNSATVPTVAGSNAFYRVRTIPDRVAPPKITNLKAKLAFPGHVLLSWAVPAADNVGGTGILGTRIFRNGVFLTQVFHPLTNYIDSTVQPGEVYDYAVFTVDWALNPSAVSGVRVEFLGATVTLAWDPNPETDIAGYILTYWRGFPEDFRTSIDVGNVLRYTIRMLLPDEVYFFSVHAYNTSDDHGPDSEIINFRTPSLP